MKDTASILNRVAQTLGIPVDEFLLDQPATEDRITRSHQTVALLRAFQDIADRQARQRCVSYVQSEAKRSKRQA